MTIWGNHSATQYPDIFHAEVDGKHAAEVDRRPGVDRERRSSPRCQARRGDHRGARAVVGRVGRERRHRPRAHWALGTPDGDWVSMGIPSDGSYGVAEGLISSFPCTCANGAYEIVRASTSTSSPRPHRRLGRPSSAEERDAVTRARPDLSYFRNLLVVLSARILPPVWQVGQ